MKIIHLEGEITKETAEDFRRQLPSNGEPVVLDIFSEGGGVIPALRICDIIRSYSGKFIARVSSAFSAATLISSACAEVQITPNGQMMIHAPHFEAESVSSSEQSLLGSLHSRMTEIYREKTSKPLAMVSAWLESEIFFDAQTAIAAGLADRICSEPIARAPRVVAVGPTLSWKRAIHARTSIGKTFMTAADEVDRVYPGLRQQMIQEANGKR